MKRYGLIGYPLSHSFSGKYFTEKFEKEGIKDCAYHLYPIRHIGLLPQLIAEHEDLIGLNVTIPYKEQVIPYLHSLDEPVRQIGAVNTIHIIRNGKSIHLKGFNTDVYGFSASFQPWLKGKAGNALILGTGGASRAVAWVLEKWGFHITWISRTPRQSNHISYEMVTPDLIRNSKIIVNASPVGMYPHVDAFPLIPYEYITADHILFDLIYNPQETRFLAKGREKGAIVINGMQMLRMQADKAWEIWNTGSL